MAGRFYPGDAPTLAREVDRYLAADRAPVRAKAVVGPHAGYIYSGAICGATYARVVVPDRVILMCPNHTGMGARRSLWSGGDWLLPGGAVPVDHALVRELQERAHLEADTAAHLHEHAAEVHVPFIRARCPSVRIAPITLAGLALADCREIGLGIASVIEGSDDDILIAASTDMSHYIPAESARELDGLALDRIAALDPEGLYDTVRGRGITMCGFVPTTVALFAANALGATAAELVRYGNSGEVSGDYDQVVGYAGVVVT